jgi:hypothetical protein
MAKFRKKPVVIDAVHWLGTDESFNEACALLDTCDIAYYKLNAGQDAIVIPTLEGDMTASIGDWIIKGVNGEPYPCKPDIFEKTYEAVDG